jgi:hypothetical protein
MVEVAVDPVVVTDVLVELAPPQPATIAATATAVGALNLIGLTPGLGVRRTFQTAERVPRRRS